MTDLFDLADLPERQKVQIQLVENNFKELLEAGKRTETSFQAGHKLLLLGDYRAAMRCFEDCDFYARVLARRYDVLSSNIRQLREYSIICADNEERE